MRGQLSLRERQTLQLLAEGCEPCEIASRLGIPQSTVRSRLSTARLKTGQASTLQAVLAAVRRGWVHAPTLTPSEEIVWREQFEAHLQVIETYLRSLGRFPLPPVARAYLNILDEHLAARHFEELKLDDTRARMRELIDHALNRDTL